MRSPGAPAVRRDLERAFWLYVAKGATTRDAALAQGVSVRVGDCWFRDRGGMPSIQLTSLSGRYLSFAEREEIALLKVQGMGVRGIARRLGRSPSTISRELRRNAATRGGRLECRASVAQWKADLAAPRPKVSKLAANDRLRAYVQDRLSGSIVGLDGELVAGPPVVLAARRRGHRADRRWARAWSPEQMSARLPIELPDDDHMRVSHEAIYQALYIQGRGALKRELVTCLRSGRALRVPRARTRDRSKGYHPLSPPTSSELQPIGNARLTHQRLLSRTILRWMTIAPSPLASRVEPDA